MGKNPVRDQLSDKTYVHIMTSITLKAGWQMQQIGQMAPKEIEMTVWLAKAFKTSLFRVLRDEWGNSILKMAVGYSMGKGIFKNKPKSLKIKIWVKNAVDVINTRLDKAKESHSVLEKRDPAVPPPRPWHNLDALEMRAGPCGWNVRERESQVSFSGLDTRRPG